MGGHTNAAASNSRQLTELLHSLADLKGTVLLVHVARDCAGAVAQPETEVLDVTPELLGDLVSTACKSATAGDCKGQKRPG